MLAYLFSVVLYSALLIFPVVFVLFFVVNSKKLVSLKLNHGRSYLITYNVADLETAGIYRFVDNVVLDNTASNTFFLDVDNDILYLNGLGVVSGTTAPHTLPDGAPKYIAYTIRDPTRNNKLVSSGRGYISPTNTTSLYSLSLN